MDTKQKNEAPRATNELNVERLKTDDLVGMAAEALDRDDLDAATAAANELDSRAFDAFGEWAQEQFGFSNWESEMVAAWRVGGCGEAMYLLECGFEFRDVTDTPAARRELVRVSIALSQTVLLNAEPEEMIHVFVVEARKRLNGLLGLDGVVAR